MSPVNQKVPQPGDLIEIFHDLYKHWAVYVGDGFVVHLTTANGSSATSSSGSSSGAVSMPKAMVKYEKLKAVVGDAKWKINNLRDGQRRPLDAKIIVAKAFQLVGSEPEYNLFLNNCEHFATEMRYGTRRSRQVSLPGEICVYCGSYRGGLLINL
uniref:LRAT domain-containing protein n=1 Tax=Gadus morhua TaxID=8049 RepID=A0A8C5CC17_GADMO